jgi:general L-amino acid transport system substrate-binding protein
LKKRTKKLLSFRYTSVVSVRAKVQKFFGSFFQKRTAFFLLLATAAHAEPAKLRCGLITEPLDWNKTDLHANLSPLGEQMCRAVATALYGDPDRVDFQNYSVEDTALAALQTGQADIVAGVTPSAQSAGRFGVLYTMPFFQDAQGVMVHRDEGIHTLADLTGHKLCFIDSTDNDAIAQAALFGQGIHPFPFGFQEEGEMDAAIMDRHCQATTALLSKLAEARATFKDARDYVFLPDAFTLVPVAMAVTQRDARLQQVANYTISALLQAEFLGITKAAAPTVTSGDDPLLQRLLGDDIAAALGLGLPHGWSRKMVAAIGNYGEIYDATVGAHSELALPRGVNALWNRGGVMAPLPLQ